MSAKGLVVIYETKWKSVVCEMKICDLPNENPYGKLHMPEEWIGQLFQPVDNT